ncbi:peroxisome membrane protein [Stereum hirsutum FP-91666 SS1]|uniref:peroxisome membrane protein n=1 Tax=Stereum hirsutum (strain FP-91666) TaxID=721885 RepID=UPI000440B747|nr:peroxisome membrane protein [Stereum hirsutum FP-91666 SS1]EIM92513.1 peroxisome membrane protein [Stereum hirsutum FP-91666 SS1]
MSSAIASYESFLVKNVSTISSVESTLRSITWLLPGRFKDAELASEALAASLNVLSLYHDTLLARIIDAEPKHKPLLPPSLHTRYTRAWADGHVRYKWIARVLELVRFTELLIEMGLRRKFSEKGRWRGIVLLEAIKAMLRFALLRITRRPILSPPIPERDIDPANLPPPSNTSSPTLAPSSPPSSPPLTPEHLRNNHVPLHPHPLLASPLPQTKHTSPVEEYLLSKALTTASVKTPTSLVRPLVSPKEWLSESLYIIRPLIYAIMLSADRKSNRPLMVSLAMELLSRNIRRVPSNSSSLERGEYARRDRDLFWYLVRGSIWETWTRPKLEAFANNTERIPVFNLISGLLKDWMPLIDEYHYYTAS